LESDAGGDFFLGVGVFEVVFIMVGKKDFSTTESSDIIRVVKIFQRVFLAIGNMFVDPFFKVLFKMTKDFIASVTTDRKHFERKIKFFFYFWFKKIQNQFL
jgi:hypothetical protein